MGADSDADTDADTAASENFLSFTVTGNVTQHVKEIYLIIIVIQLIQWPKTDWMTRNARFRWQLRLNWIAFHQHILITNKYICCRWSIFAFQARTKYFMIINHEIISNSANDDETGTELIYFYWQLHCWKHKFSHTLSQTYYTHTVRNIRVFQQNGLFKKTRLTEN